MPSGPFGALAIYLNNLPPVTAKKDRCTNTMASLGSARGQFCDVFICHRGPEVKRNLVGHIKERLQRANLIVFVDYELRKGVESWPSTLATLRGARRVLVLLTQALKSLPGVWRRRAQLLHGWTLCCQSCWTGRPAGMTASCGLPTSSSQLTGISTSCVPRSLGWQPS